MASRMDDGRAVRRTTRSSSTQRWWTSVCRSDGSINGSAQLRKIGRTMGWTRRPRKRLIDLVDLSLGPGQPVRSIDSTKMQYIRHHAGRLFFRSGRVVICDPVSIDDPMFEVPAATYGDFYFIDESSDSDYAQELVPGVKVRDIAALEIRFSDQSSGLTSIRKIGLVGVDSAQIVVADEQDLEDCVPDPLFITEEGGAVITQKLIDEHSLVTKHLSDGWIEVLSDERESVYQRLYQSIEILKLGDPDELLFYKRWGDFFGLFERVEMCCYDGPLMSLGNSDLFKLSPNGSDGQYGVYVESCNEQILRCWILIHDDFFVNGYPSGNIMEVVIPND